MNYLIYEIKKIPDLVLAKYQSLGESGVEGVLEKHSAFLRQWQRVSLICSAGIHLLLQYKPEEQKGRKIAVYFVISYDDNNYCMKFKQMMSASPLSSYYVFKETLDNKPEEQLQKMVFPVCATIKKIERKKNTEDNSGLQLYTVEGWESNEDARLYDMLKTMSSLNEAVVYAISLYGVNAFERAVQALDKPISYLRKRTFGINDHINLKGNVADKARDIATEETLKTYEELLTSVATSPCFQANIRVFANDSLSAEILLNTACSEAISKGDCEIISQNASSNNVLDLITKCHLYSNLVPESLKFWPTLMTLEEVAPFFRLPVLFDGEFLEIEKETIPAIGTEGLYIGDMANDKAICINQSGLMKHAFICGVPGSGKTNTMLHIANSLWHNTELKFDEKIEHPVPFLVLEPAKREYRELSLYDIPELIIFSPSANTRFPLEINPFEFPKGLTLSEHIIRLRQVFEGAFPMQPPAPFILDQSIEAIYVKHGWNTSDINDGEKEYPTMTELYEEFERQLETTSYDSEIQGNIRSVLEMRIGSLIRREKKDIFDVPKSLLAPEEWIKHPIVVELEALGKEGANFVTLLLCTLIRETLKTNPMEGIVSEEIHSSDSPDMKKLRVYKPLRHIIFIEEAHNLIATQTQIEGNSESNPKIAATECIVDMLKEVRALREGIIIADQLPTAMALDVIKNTNIKLVHRLTSSDDRQLVGNTMSASELQLEQVATYMPGQALMTYEGLLRPFEIQVCNLENHGSEVPDDDELYHLMKEKPGQSMIYMRLEGRKWADLQNKVKNVLQLENSHRRALREYDYANKSKNQIEDFLEQCVSKCQALKLIKQTYQQEFNLLSPDYIEADIIEKTENAIKEISEAYCDEVKIFIQSYL